MTKQQFEALKHALLTQGPISVSGTMQVDNSSTAMGFAGYKINAEIIAPFEEKGSKGTSIN